MATYTSHYNLKKPATSDKIRIADFNGNADTIDATMYDNATLGAQLKADIGIVENTNTASHNISEGQYVIWNGSLYVASSAISSGATLSNANLTAVSNGGLNALNSNISITPLTTSKEWSSDIDIHADKVGHIVHVSGWIILNNITYNSERPCLIINVIPYHANNYVFDNEGTLYNLKRSAGGVRSELYFNATTTISAQKYVFFNFTFPA